MELRVVNSVLHHHPSVGALHHVGPTISSFLGPSAHLPFHRACTFGSIALLDWIWNASCTSVATRPSGWSLANFLRSDPHYHRWEFLRSMEIAASRGDLEVIEWLFTHFSDCSVPTEAVAVAASKGYLVILQYLLDHDSYNQGTTRINVKKIKVVTESGELVSSPASAKTTHAVFWDTCITEPYNKGLVKVAIDNGHIDTARWLFENIPTESDGRNARGAIEAALNRNDMELAESFVPPNRHVMEYADYFTGNIQVVERMIDCGYLQENSDYGVVAINDLVASGRLDLMQTVANLRYSPPRNKTEWSKVWQDVLKGVCYHGDTAMVQWALGHPLGRQACQLLKRNDELSHLLRNAVAGGNGVKILQSLEDSGAADKYRPALIEAVAKNDMNCIQWLLDNFPRSEYISAYCVLDEAARRGILTFWSSFKAYPRLLGAIQQQPSYEK